MKQISFFYYWIFSKKKHNISIIYLSIFLRSLVALITYSIIITNVLFMHMYLYAICCHLINNLPFILPTVNFGGDNPYRTWRSF